MVEHNCVPAALWEGEKKENFLTLTLVPSRHENLDSLRKEKLILCIRTSYSTTNSVTQTCNCAFSALKRQERRDKQGYRDIQHLDPFSSCISLIWRSRPGLEAQYISPYKISQSLMFILGFLKSLYTLSLHCDFGSFE